MADETKVTDTTATGGDPAKPESLTSGTGGDAEAPIDWKAKAELLQRELLAQKPKIEAANRILNAQAERDPDPTPAGTGEARSKSVEEWAAEGDPVAQRQLRLERHQRLADELTEMRRRGLEPEEEERMLEAFRTDPLKYGDRLTAALAEVRLPTLEEQNQALREQLRLAEVNAKARDPNTIHTATREVTASRLKGTISDAQFRKDQKSLPMEEALKQQRAYLNGDLIVES